MRSKLVAAVSIAALSLTLAAPVGATEEPAAPLPGSTTEAENADRSGVEVRPDTVPETAADPTSSLDADEPIGTDAEIADAEIDIDAQNASDLDGINSFTEAEVVGFAEADDSPVDFTDQQLDGDDPGFDSATAGIGPTVENGTMSLPAPQPGAEVYNRPSDGIYQVTGGGFGHGIGMSQYGAHGAGLAGLTHSQILAFYYSGTQLETRTTSTIRVGISIDNNGVTQVMHRSGLRIGNGHGATSYVLPASNTQYRVRATSAAATSCRLEGFSGGSWSQVSVTGLAQSCPMTFTSSSEGTVDLVLPGGQQRIYRGSMSALHAGSSSALTSVNTVGVQDYLRSVTMAEMPVSFHQEGLRAQSVAARTYALSSARSPHFEVCDTTACQVYRGRGIRNANGTITAYEHSITDAAVSATNGQVLTYLFPNGQRRLITAMYSSSTGGHTADAFGVAEHGYLSAKPDPYDNVSNNSRHTWTAQLPASALGARYGIHNVQRVQILSRDGDGKWGGRVLDARIEGYTANGTYTWAYANGGGIAQARPWPAFSDGLSSNYFTFAGGSTSGPQRIEGPDRYATAGEVSRQWTGPVSVVYVVSGETHPDALVAAARSGVFDAPVLLTQQDHLPTSTRTALQRLNPNRIVVVGSTGVVNNVIYEQLRGFTRSGTMERVAGTDRYGTAAAMAAYYSGNQQRVVLASGDGFADALAAAALAAHHKAPLLLTRPDRLDPATIAQLGRLNASQLIVVGGTGVISQQVAQEAASYGRNTTVRRIGGEHRYSTMELVAREFPTTHKRAYVASGEQFPDALVGAALAGNRGGPIILTHGTRVPQATARALNRIAPTAMLVLGGTATISNPTLNLLGSYLR